MYIIYYIDTININKQSLLQIKSMKFFAVYHMNVML